MREGILLFELLKADHDKVSDLMMRIEEGESEEDTTQQEIWFAELQRDLENHTMIEEDIVYPALENHANLRPLAIESEKDHETVRLLLEELEDLSPDSELWRERFAELKDAVERHVSEEENVLFDRMVNEMPKDEIAVLGNQVQVAREEYEAA